MADVESKLSWRNHKLSKTNDQTNPLGTLELNHKPICSKQLSPEDTRFTHPLDNYRGMSLTDLMIEPYLHVNPQCHIQPIDDRLGLNSRLNAKDMFKIDAQDFWDKGEALPKEIPIPPQTCDI